MKRSLIAVTAFLFVCAGFLIQHLIHEPKTFASPPESSPISLTNPDGQSLTLEKYDLRAAVHGALALVEMEMVFRNPQARQMEGRFVYTLPTGSTISRFAKEVNGQLMEGEVVERMRAQQIFTEILHTMRDPALLETDQGNRFSARIFPVPASGTVRLLLAFSQTLPLKDGVRKLTIPLAGLPKIGDFSFNAIGKPLEAESGSGVVLDKDESLDGNFSGFHRHAVDFEPKKDIELVFKSTNAAPVRAMKSGNFQMVQFRYDAPIETRTAIPASPDWSFYFDTSASGADIEAPRLQALDKVLNGLVPVLREKNNLFSAHAFDIDVAQILGDTSMTVLGDKPIMPEVIYKLRARHVLGATNLEAALKSIGEQARAAKNPRTFVLASDGIPTWAAREPAALLAALGEWPAQHTLHALVVGTREDDRILKVITEKANGRIVHLPLGGDLDANVTKAIAELRAPIGAHFEVYDEGTAWIYPKEFHDVRPGTELVAFSELKAGAKSKPGFVQRGADGKIVKDTPADVAPLEVADFGPLLQREAYKAYLDVLDKNEQAEKDATKRAEIHRKRIEVSVKNRVLCPLTSLLVLETENDYRRFGLDRYALTDVMQVGLNGIEMRKRVTERPPEVVRNQGVPPVKTPPIPELRKQEERAREHPTPVAKALSDMHRDPQSGRELNFAVDALEEREADKDGLGFGRLATGGGPGEARARGLAEAGDHFESIDALQQDLALDRPAAAGAAAPHPFAPAPTGAARGEPARDAAPQQAQEQLSRHPEPGGANGVPAQADRAKKMNLDWTEQGTVADEQLSALRAAVQGHPTDRRARNAYADALYKAKKWDNLQAEVFQWLPFDPENPAVYEFLGKSATGLNDGALALRAYSSIAEIAPNRAALLARAGWLLLAAKKCDLAEAMFTEALKNRQDDANIHRGLGLSRWLGGKFEESAAAYESALMKDYNQRYGDVKRVLREEYAYVLRAWRKKDAAKADAILARAQNAGIDLFRNDALRVTMCWETDANDVDLHIVDPSGEECFYSHKNNASGLELYSDQTQGLGPEVIRTQKTQPGTYHIGVNYFSAGPMGVSRGVVIIMKPADGVDENPEVIPFALIEGGKDMRLVGTASF